MRVYSTQDLFLMGFIGVCAGWLFRTFVALAQ